ncbi:MAG: hypothetical protein FJX42_08110 [Alphaproteobacteria bacterium]|nr:hypothetical protein [Alphaproteobacteria bacterium]
MADAAALDDLGRLGPRRGRGTGARQRGEEPGDGGHAFVVQSQDLPVHVAGLAVIQPAAGMNRIEGQGLADSPVQPRLGAGAHGAQLLGEVIGALAGKVRDSGLARNAVVAVADRAGPRLDGQRRARIVGRMGGREREKKEGQDDSRERGRKAGHVFGTPRVVEYSKCRTSPG